MRKLHTRILVGTAVAAVAVGTAFAVTSTVGTSTASATADTAALAVTTGKADTTLSIAVAKDAIAAGRRDVISGTLTTGSAPAARRIVELYRYNAKRSKWIPAQVNLTRKGGVVHFAVRPLITAEYELVYHGNATLAASHSTTVTITVTK
jgi:hypothetical protein